MKNIEVEIANNSINGNEKPEGSLDEIVNWEFVEDFAKTFEELGAFSDLEIPEKPSVKVQEKLRAVVNFFERNNYENAKVIAFGMAVMLGKSAVEFVGVIDEFELYSVEDLKLLLKACAEDPGVFKENLFIGAGSAIAQRAIETAKRKWENNELKIKEGLKRIIKISSWELTHEPTNS